MDKEETPIEIGIFIKKDLVGHAVLIGKTYFFRKLTYTIYFSGEKLQSLATQIIELNKNLKNERNSESHSINLPQ